MKKHRIQNIENTGFKIPKDYFTNLEDSIFNQIKSEELSKETGFKTPEHYFDSIEESVLNKISAKENKPIISIFNKRNLIYTTGIAASILLIISISIFNKKHTWEDIHINTVENYIINENIESYELANMLFDYETGQGIIEIEYDDEALEDYILENASVDELIKK